MGGSASNWEPCKQYMSKVVTQNIVVIFMLLIMNIATRRDSRCYSMKILSYNIFNIIMLLFLVFGWGWGLEGQYSEAVN